MQHDAAISRGQQLRKVGRLDEAAGVFETILEQDPAHAEAAHLRGVVALEQRQFEDAAAWIEKAIGLGIASASPHLNLAAVYGVLGRFADAETQCREAIRHQPDLAEAYFNMSALRRFTEEDSDLAAIEELLGDGNLTDQDRCHLRFAAGKMSDDIGQCDRAFEHFRVGNELKAAPFDLEQHRQFVDRSIAAVSAWTVNAKRNWGSDSDVPIFVVGMPRSGTTLVEQILASHDDVFGAGELPDVQTIAATMPRYVPGGFPYPECVGEAGADLLRGMGDAYVQRVRTMNATARRVVDKYPLNYLYVGLITLMLPEARIVHCSRDPLDTCLSCYFQLFRGGQEFSYDLTHLGHYYREYERLMEHWRTVMRKPIIDVDYETLIDDPEPVCRQLVGFCGLDWQPECLQFHQSGRNVSTASNWQVRQPLYRSSVGRWAKYRTHLGPLREALKM